MASKSTSFLNHFWVRFVPALVVWPIWVCVVSTNAAFQKVFEFWPASVAMVLGSFIAGSTPLGGGVVAFPISVLVLEFTPTESRDASLLVQSVGMNAAAYLLFTTKRELLDPAFIIINILFGTLGMIFGLTYPVSGETINLIYTVGVFEFGILYFYKNKYASSDSDEAPESLSRSDSDSDEVPRLIYLGMAACAVLGGFLTAKVGSGSDIMLYAFGVFMWNKWMPRRRLSDNHLTASSVVVMGVMSALTALTRALSPDGFTSRVVYTWGAMAFVVVMGAPVGSLVLTPTSVPYLRMLFYVLAVVQLCLFGALKIKGDAMVWLAITAVTLLQLLLLTTSFCVRKRRKSKKKGGAVVQDVAKSVEEGVKGDVAVVVGQEPCPTYDSSTTASVPGDNSVIVQV